MKFIFEVFLLLATIVDAQIDNPDLEPIAGNTYRLKPRLLFGIGSLVSNDNNDGGVVSFESINFKYGKRENLFENFSVNFFMESGIVFFNSDIVNYSEGTHDDFILPVYLKLGPEIKITDGLFFDISAGGVLFVPYFYPYPILGINANYRVGLSRNIFLEIESGAHIIPLANSYPTYLPYLGIGISFN